MEKMDSFLIKRLGLILVAMFIAVSAWAQKPVSGKVVDSMGDPLPGVSVVVKGTTTGTITDIDGIYKLDVPEDATLVFSFIGMNNVTMSVSGKSAIDITMTESSIGLDEVVAVGYGTMKKSDLTGSVTSVNSRSFEAQPITKMDQALQGRAAGVQVTQTSGAPGGTMKIRIRGANSISGNNNPLYVVDGMVVGDIGSINVNDIASMEVLKDASATAIYGSRGANGVVLISTKKGAKGKAQITFETFHGISNIIQRLPVMEAWEFAEGVNFAEGVGNERYTQDEIDALKENGGTNWQDELFKAAPSHNYQLSFSGGTDKVDYFLSASIYNAEGTIINQDYTRYTVRANVNAQVTEKLKIGINISGSREELNGTRADLSDGLTYDPASPVYDDNGDYVFTSEKNVANSALNPVINPNEKIRNSYDNRLTTTSYLDYKIMDNLVLNVSGGLNYYNKDNNAYTPLAINGRGNATVENGNTYTLQNTNRLTYTLKDAGAHSLQIDAIHEQQYYQSKYLLAKAEQFFSDQTSYKDLALAQIQNIENGDKASSLQSFLGRVNYTFANKYLLTASLRADGSSKFREGNQWGYFPSGSIAWRLSEEGFIKNIMVISNLKLRASFGVTGSQAIDIFATRSQPLTGVNYNYPFTGDAAFIGVAPSNRLANEDLTWEKTQQANIGFDLGLFDNKITLSTDVYAKKTTDLLLDVFLPEFVGPTVQAQNIGVMQNRGFEFSLGWTPDLKGDWSVSNTFTFNLNRNEVVELYNDTPIEMGDEYIVNTFAANPTRVEVGKPLGSFRGYVFQGVWQTSEADEAALWGRKPGDAKYKDVSGPNGEPDGLISADDITTVGDGNPDFTFGLNGNVSYKNLSLDYLFTGSVGNDIYNFQRGRMMSLGASTFHAVHADYKKRWTEDKPSNSIPSGRNGTELLSSAFVEDGSYLALKNVSLAYTLKNVNPLKSIGVDALKVYGSIENAFVLTKYTGFDPESTASGGSDVDLGIDINTYPLARTFTIGVKLTF